jgi:Spy/CpxP family protein refolding chaperone
MSRSLCLVFFVTLAACARSAAPLAGDSVSADGSVTLTPPRMSTSPSPIVHESDPIRDRLFPPELVMEHQGEIDLTIVQRETITKEVDKLQKDMLALQWEMQREKEKLVKALDADRVDEAATTASSGRVMEIETKIKSAHLAMLVHVKNVLTPDQQRKLRVVRDQERCAPAPSVSAKPPAPRKKAAPATSNPDVF